MKGVPMANPEHSEILKQGVEVWNRWRKDHPDIRPYLVEVNLRRTNLNGSYLREACLVGVDLRWASLIESNLGKATLLWADLRNADLSGTNLSEANLQAANLIGANLSGVNLNRCSIGFTTFVDIDLSNVKGLESVEHHGPSYIGVDTIYRSKGKIPESFLRGTGIPESFIRAIPSLIKEATSFYSCFISYSSANEDFAKQLLSDLQAKGVRCWFAPEDLKWGVKTWDGIDEAIGKHDKLLLVLSENSIRSDWVEDEVTKGYAEERKRNSTVLFPIQIDNAVMETYEPWAAKLRDGRNIGDFRDWENPDSYQKAFERLLRDLKADETPAATENK
jgi:hypothetical protein